MGVSRGARRERRDAEAMIRKGKCPADIVGFITRQDHAFSGVNRTNFFA